MKKFKAVTNIIPVWLTFTFVITLLSGLVYASVQQSLRQGANDPQIQVAEDLADRLNQSNQIPSLSQTVDLKKSLSTFVIIYNYNGQPITSTAYLDSQIPSPPIGVFQSAEKNKENRITWEPQNQVRIAAVVVPFGNKTGFILAGRSLREVEKRVDQITAFTFIIWLVSIIGSLIVLLSIKLIFY